MLTIPLDQVYSCIAATKDKIAVCGKSGVSLLNSKYELSKISEVNSYSLSFSPLGLLGVCSGKNLEVYDNLNKIWNVEKHSRRVQDLSWSQSGLLASCSKDSKLLVWDLRTPQPCIAFNPTKGLGVYCVAWSRISSDIIASGHETALKLWDARLPKKALCTVRSAHPGRIIHLDWHYSQNNLLSSSLLSTVKVWKTTSTNLAMVNSVQTYFQSIQTCFSPDNNRVLYISEKNDEKIHFLGGDDLKAISSFYIGNTVEDMDWHDKSLAVLCADRMLKIVNFDGKDLEDRGENVVEVFSDSDAIECSISVISFEEEIKHLQDSHREGIVVEDIGYNNRYSLIRIHNDREFLRYMLTFPMDYPDSPPDFSLQSYSKYLSTTVPEELKRIDSELQKKSKWLCKSKSFTVQKICDFLVNHLNQITSTDGYEDFNDFLDAKLDYPNYSKNTPVSCIHSWHTSGELLIFISAEPAMHYGERDDFFELENSHYQEGIQYFFT